MLGGGSAQESDKADPSLRLGYQFFVVVGVVGEFERRRTMG